ncbi:hypothetical protein DXG03_004593 [Asterophora parasitica]|uniref:Uncharacterized protein n=1 Tax=Asterophora parasitica TaxID=117018 RepID=A0A9P7G8G3_9AGAR|nr:hypothetical protein DXG03_004593 [Asterophora parasitica]
MCSGNSTPKEPQTIPSVSRDSSLLIPEARDGFFGYTEEKSLQHIEGKYLAQRRSSDAVSDTSLAGSFKHAVSLQPPYSEEQINLSATALEEEEAVLTAELHASETLINSEYASLFQSFQKCLNLRDKYMCRSLQRLGDNPKDFDGHEPSIDKDLGEPGTNEFEPWKIYPRPPPPHWHWKEKDKVVSSGETGTAEPDEFRFEDCHIPKAHGWTFRLDDTGVYQVYDDKRQEPNAGEKKPAFDIPSIKEYFVDLDFVLGVIADGPTKSFAFRRLKYLASKFDMYTLLNEFQELADMKVGSSLPSYMNSSLTRRLRPFRTGTHCEIDRILDM